MFPVGSEAIIFIRCTQISLNTTTIKAIYFTEYYQYKGNICTNVTNIKAMINSEDNILKILDILYEYNPWWKSSEFHIPEYRTKWFDSLTSAMDDPEIEIVYGPQQVGKT